jgi:hypothetical protein
MKWFFKPAAQDLMSESNTFSVADIRNAFEDNSIRRRWLTAVTNELARIHLEVDGLLESDAPYEKTVALSARRKAISWILEQVMIAKTSKELAIHHNPDERFVS